MLEAALMEPATQVAGGVVIFDMEGLSLQQCWQFTPQIAKRIVDWLQVSIRSFNGQPIFRAKMYERFHTKPRNDTYIHFLRKIGYPVLFGRLPG